MKKYQNEEEYLNEEYPQPVIEKEFGCGFCWDKRKLRTKELFFLDAANNMRQCYYCPNCGRALQED